MWGGVSPSGLGQPAPPCAQRGKSEKNPAILTAAPFRGLPQPEVHYRSGFNDRPYEVRGCVVRFRVVFLLPLSA
ncbi:hypothetical protein BUJ37_000005 [Salmonella enterica subsp. enterica serovar Muenchen]|nr:hypothetical protein BUJ37_000005 [Salmonella enterica subsp. enterica serovar Muenchen]